MPKVQSFTSEFREQAVRFVLDELLPDESRKQACFRLAPKFSMKPVTLYNWVKQSAPGVVRPVAVAGSVEELRGALVALRKENRELVRANEILKAASAFFGAELDRQSKR